MAKPTSTTLTRNLRLLPTVGANSKTGLFGEIGYDRGTNTLVVYDGITQGGFPLLKADLSNLEGSIIDVKGSVFGDDSTLLVDAVSSKIVGPVETTTVSASLGFTGNLTGNVSGNVNGIITGQAGSTINGNLTGNVTGNISSTGSSSFSNIDVNGGTIDGTTIGSSAASTIVGTTITASTKFVGNLEGNVTGNISGNAGTVTNGVYTNQTYNDPAWITGLNASKISFTTGPSITYQGSGSPNFTVKTTTTALNFGNDPVSSRTFVISDPAALITSRIIINPHPSADNGALGGDEFELDPIAVSAVCTTNGSISVFASSLQGPVKGIRNFQYVVI